MDDTPSASEIQILVKTVIGKPVTIPVDATVTTERVKSKFQDKVGVPVGFQRLLFAGRQLEAGQSQAAGRIRARWAVRVGSAAG